MLSCNSVQARASAASALLAYVCVTTNHFVTTAQARTRRSHRHWSWPSACCCTNTPRPTSTAISSTAVMGLFSSAVIGRSMMYAVPKHYGEEVLRVSDQILPDGRVLCNDKSCIGMRQRLHDILDAIRAVRSLLQPCLHACCERACMRSPTKVRPYTRGCLQ